VVMLLLRIGVRSVVHSHHDQDLGVDMRSVKKVLGQIK
jgi:hypothetical protein